VTLSDALGRFADDDDGGGGGESDDLLGNAGAVGGGESSGRGNHDGGAPAAQAFEGGRPLGVASPPPSRVAFVEGGDRAVALALLEERANVSVTRAATTALVFSFTQKAMLSTGTL
jgi:hypothetical protein